jgi:hypothetical protein
MLATLPVIGYERIVLLIELAGFSRAQTDRSERCPDSADLREIDGSGARLTIPIGRWASLSDHRLATSPRACTLRRLLELLRP